MQHAAERKRSSHGRALLPLTLTALGVVWRETIIVSRRQGMAIRREKLFVLMARNAVRATAFSACARTCCRTRS
jgi:hypothetical protein